MITMTIWWRDEVIVRKGKYDKINRKKTFDEDFDDDDDAKNDDKITQPKANSSCLCKSY